MPLLQDLPPVPGDLPKVPTSLPKVSALPPVPKLDTTPVVPKVQQPSATIPKLTDESPDETAQHTDNFGWLTNLPKSLFNQVKGLAYDLPKAAITSAVNYAKDPAQYGKDLDLALAKNSGLGTMFKEQFVDYYAKDFWHNFNEDPARLLGDAAAVLSLGGGAVAKAGELGKLAGVARVGSQVAEVGNYLDPIMLAGKAASKAAAPILEGLGFGKYSDQLNSGRALLRATQSMEMNSELNKVIFGSLKPEENARLERLIRWGDPRETELASQGTDLVSKRFNLWKDTITGGDEPIYKRLGVLDEESARHANAVKMSEYSNNHFHELGLEAPIKPREALARMESGVNNPTFMSSYRLKNSNADLFDMMNRGMYRGGVWSRFEQTTGMKSPVLADMDTVMARQIAAKHDSLYKLKLVDLANSLMNEAGQRVFIAKGGEMLAMPKGFAPLQDAFFKKYWGDMARGSEINATSLANGMKAAKSPEESLALARNLIESDKQITAPLLTQGDVYVPRHVAAWLNRELAPISPIGRMYDSAMSHFKGLATVFNPKFWGSVIFGNSVLGTIYGVSPDVARIVHQNRDFLSPELKQLSRAEVYLKDRGIYARVANNLGEAASMLDNIFKQTIFGQEVANSPVARMKFAAGNFFMSSEQVAQAVRFYGQAPEKLMSTRLAIESLQQELRPKLLEAGQIDQKIAKLEPQMLAANKVAAGEKMPPVAITKPTGSITINPETGAIQKIERWYANVDKGLTPKTEADQLAIRLRNEVGNLETYAKGLREDAIHKLSEIGELQRRIPSLVQDAAIADRAIEVGNRFYGSYARLSPFERKTLRRILPFYTFNKAMTMLAFRFPFLYPKRAFIGSHLAQAWNDLTSDENSYMPQRLRDYIPVAARQDGSVVAISSGFLNPLSSVRVGDFAELPLPTVFNPLRSNPVIALILKMNGSIPEWSAKPLSPGEYSTRLDNGTVVRWTGQGFQTVVAQPSIFKSLADLFPQSQLIDRLLHPYAQTDRGWLFHPDPILDPNGQPKYPKELLDTYLGAIIPTSTYDLQEVKAQEQQKMQAVIKSYIKDLRFATPVRRDQILEILRGWQEEKNRKWVQ
jgi:hypothetical protein